MLDLIPYEIIIQITSWLDSTVNLACTCKAINAVINSYYKEYWGNVIRKKFPNQEYLPFQPRREYKELCEREERIRKFNNIVQGSELLISLSIKNLLINTSYPGTGYLDLISLNHLPISVEQDSSIYWTTQTYLLDENVGEQETYTRGQETYTREKRVYFAYRIIPHISLKVRFESKGFPDDVREDFYLMIDNNHFTSIEKFDIIGTVQFLREMNGEYEGYTMYKIGFTGNGKEKFFKELKEKHLFQVIKHGRLFSDEESSEICADLLEKKLAIE